MSSYYQHQSLRELKAMREAEAREIRQREETAEQARLAPLRVAEAALKESANALAKATREKILNGVDDEFLASLDPETKGLSMPRAKAAEFNRQQFELFQSQRPDAYWSNHNHGVVGDFLARNGLAIAPLHVLNAAWDRLTDYQCLERRPEPQPEPEPIPAPQPEPIRIDPEQARQERWERYTKEIVVTDPETGTGFTQYMLDRADSSTFKRVMRLKRSDLDLIAFRR